MRKTKLATLTATASLATTLLFSAGAAQAIGLSVMGGSAMTFGGYNGQPATSTGVYTSGLSGSLLANTAGTVKFTYLGNESGFNNSFSFLGTSLSETNTVGQSTASVAVNSGLLDFSFTDSTGASTGNSTPNTPVLGFAILNGNLTPVSGPDYGPFDYVLGFNDSSNGDADYDDFVVGVNFTPLSPVPLPASLPLLALALGFFTFARRRI
ncbi:MAG: hypothetical protein V4629_06985 [Pseudomonadota bacterium]